jgi:hypothetical protein
MRKHPPRLICRWLASEDRVMVQIVGFAFLAVGIFVCGVLIGLCLARNSVLPPPW